MNNLISSNSTETAETVDNAMPPSAHVAEFTKDIDAAMGIEPEAAWPMIAKLYDDHGYNCVYDLGVIGVMILGIGWIYLSRIS
jgi:hypothetical protein